MVMVFAALAPTLSHAFTKNNGAKNIWQEICTVQGTKRIAAAITFNTKESGLSSTSSPASNSNPAAVHFEHCPFCLNHTVADALPYINNANPVVLDEAGFYFKTDYLAPVLTALLLSDHPSRAPPL